MESFWQRNKIIVAFSLTAVFVSVIAIAACFAMYRSATTIEESTKAQMHAVAQMAATVVTAEQLNRFQTQADMQRPDYLQLRRELSDFTKEYDLMFAFFLRIDIEAGEARYIIDNVLSAEDNQDGLDSPPMEINDKMLLAMQGLVAVDELDYVDPEWEGIVTGYAPIYFSNGMPSRYLVGVDISSSQIKEAWDNVRLLTALFILAVGAVLATGFFCLLLYRRKAEQAEEASRAKGNFLSRMSHEMRTPMNAVIGLTNMIHNTDDPELIADYLAKIESSSAHLRQLIDDVLDLAKIESDKITLELIPTNLRGALDKIDCIIRPQTVACRQEFTMLVDPDLPEAARFDPVHLRQVLINLLSNALKFTAEEGSITLRCRLLEENQRDALVEFSVTDNGIGMSEETVQRLFMPFEQADVSTTRRFGGTGLGLSISKQLVEMMGGEISVVSAPDEGSTFRFAIWVEKVDADRLPQKATNLEDLPLNLSGQTFLLAEDSEINQLIACDMLVRFGLKVDVVDNGQKCLQAFLEQPEAYSMILMDIQMPVMDGLEATRQIRACGAPRAETIPIVAISANVFKEDVEASIASGMNAHIQKPLDEMQVKATIRSVLNG